MRFLWLAVPVAVAAVAAARLLVPPAFAAQAPAPHVLDARASDPVTMGWMAGTPPPPDKRFGSPTGAFTRSPEPAGRSRTCAS